jgi:SAM-dependent methyltransferase
VLAENIKKIDEMLSDDHKVLDVGGGHRTFHRADHVIDILPYDERREVYEGGPRRCTRETWVVRDICEGSWPFGDKEFDFVVCSHVLEDVRDPLKVCAEMIRVGRRGYIETPSRLAESTRGHGRRYMAGHSHHRWLVEIEGSRILFTLKTHKIHHRRYSLKLGFNRRIRDEFAAVYLFWEGGFEYAENYPEDFDRFLLDFKRSQTLRGKTERRHSLGGGLRKILTYVKKGGSGLPANVLDASEQ